MFSVSPSLDGTRLAAGGKTGLVIVYRVELLYSRACVLHPLCTLTGLGDAISVALDPKAEFLVVGGDKKVVQLWTLRPVGLLDGASSPGTSAASARVVKKLHAENVLQFSCKAQVHGVSLTAAGWYTQSAKRSSDAYVVAVGTSDCTVSSDTRRGPSLELPLCPDPPRPGL